MKVLKCPKGYIGTKLTVDRAPVDILFHRPQGPSGDSFTLVDDYVADELLQHPGYEIIDRLQYPGDLEELKQILKGQFNKPLPPTKAPTKPPKPRKPQRRQSKPKPIRVSKFMKKGPLRKRLKHKRRRIWRFLNTDIRKLFRREK